MKKLAFIIACMMTLSIAAFAEEIAQVNAINVVVNGEKIEDTNILFAERTYVPLRAVLEKIGCDVGWQEENLTAVISGEIDTDTPIVPAVTPDSNQLPLQINVLDNNEIVQADVNAVRIVVNGTVIKAANLLYKYRTYIPLRAVTEEIGCTVDWDGDTRTAAITGKVLKVEPETPYTSYEEEFAAAKAKYEPKIARLEEMAKKAWDEAFASGGDVLAADQAAADTYQKLADMQARYEARIATLKTKYGITD